MVSAYALMPMVLLGIPLTFISNAMSLDYAAFYSIVNAIIYVWCGILLLSSLLVVHQYTLDKTILTAILIIVGMAIIVFLGLLFFNLISQLVGFVVSLYWEISLRFF
jgi:hypothetical protein